MTPVKRRKIVSSGLATAKMSSATTGARMYTQVSSLPRNVDSGSIARLPAAVVRQPVERLDVSSRLRWFATFHGRRKRRSYSLNGLSARDGIHFGRPDGFDDSVSISAKLASGAGRGDQSVPPQGKVGRPNRTDCPFHRAP